MVDDVPYIVVVNKIDLRSEQDSKLPEVLLKNEDPRRIEQVRVSAKTGEGMEQITGAIERWALRDSALKESGGSLNQRQGELCTKALEALAHLEEAVQLDLPQDCLATDLTTAIHCLSEACGDEVTEEVISEVFSRFCIGK